MGFKSNMLLFDFSVFHLAYILILFFPFSWIYCVYYVVFFLSIILIVICSFGASLVTQRVKYLPEMQETYVQFLA